jgi:hypothetical protein
MKNDGLMGFFSIFKQTFLGRAKKTVTPACWMFVCSGTIPSSREWLSEKI